MCKLDGLLWAWTNQIPQNSEGAEASTSIIEIWGDEGEFLVVQPRWNKMRG